MKKIILLLLIVFVQLSASHAQTKSTYSPVLRIMEKVANWQLNDWKQHGMRYRGYDWTNGACYTGFMALGEIDHNPVYLETMYTIGDSLHWNTEPNRFTADDYCIGQMYAQMAILKNRPALIARFKTLADSIIAKPHNESLEWKNDIYSREWAWCDALFMGPPALAYLATATGDRKYLDIAVKLWLKTTDYLFDKKENLYYRDSRFFTQYEANGKKVFWSRGNGWVMGGLVRMLENMPADYPERPKFVELYKKMAAKIASLQNADGSWHAALLDPSSYPIKETSGTGFYCYALAYGINHQLLDAAQYLPVVKKAWAAMVTSVHPDGKLGYVQQIGEKPETVTYDDTEVYGVGAFLLAGSEVMKLQAKL